MHSLKPKAVVLKRGRFYHQETCGIWVYIWLFNFGIVVVFNVRRTDNLLKKPEIMGYVSLSKVVPCPFPSCYSRIPKWDSCSGSLQTMDGSGRSLPFTQTDSGRNSGLERVGTRPRVGLRILTESIRTLQWPHPSLTPLPVPNQAVTDEDNRVTDPVSDACSCVVLQIL